MQLMKDNIVTMPGDFIHVFLWHVRNAVLCALTFAFLREAAVRRQEKPGLLFAAVCLAFVALWFIVPGTFIDDAFVAVRWIVVAALGFPPPEPRGLPDAWPFSGPRRSLALRRMAACCWAYGSAFCCIPCSM